LTPAAASNTLSCQRRTLHQTSSGRSNSLDADHGIYRDPGPNCDMRPETMMQRSNVSMTRKKGGLVGHHQIIPALMPLARITFPEARTIDDQSTFPP
jgi:hypothetical protein